MENLRGWSDLGVVSTIYEEEEEERCSDTTSLSSTLSPSPTPLHDRAQAWSLAKGCEPDVLIHVGGSSFQLHREPLSAKSEYLKRKLKESFELTLSPSLKITEKTFALVADFCYGSNIIITPFNVISLRVAAELLEMTKINNSTNNENLKETTEGYFCQYIRMNCEYALAVFKSCLLMVLEAETSGGLVSRCIEALISLGGDFMSCIDEMKILEPKDFQIVAESMSRRLMSSHDLLYRIVDIYLKECGGNMTEDEKTKMCNCIDCNTLSPQLLVHAVQNPKMPLRFIVQAMFIDQLNTRRSIFSAANHRHKSHHPRHHEQPVTLGAILERDATLRHTSQLMDDTTSKISSLEKDLESMRKILNNEKESGRSVSSRFEFERKVERGQKGSVSSSSLREFMRREKIGRESCSERSFEGNDKKSLARKLVSRLKSVFVGANKKKCEKTEQGQYGNGDVLVIKKNIPFDHHQCAQSLG